MKIMKMELAMKMVSVIILYIKLYNKNIFYMQGNYNVFAIL